MKNAKLLLLLTSILCIMLVFCSCESEKGTEGLVYYIQDDGNYFVGAGDEVLELTEIVIPSTYNGKKVTGIIREGFCVVKGLTKITIPSSVTYIDDYAFYSCTSLVDVTLPKNLKYLGRSAFINCTALEKIVIPDSVTKIENCCFENCTSLTNVTLPGGLKFIGAGAFRKCTSLVNINIPEGVEEIGIQAFMNCSALESIIIPASTVSLGENVIDGCSSLKKLKILGPERISDQLFDKGPAALTDLYFGDNVKVISISFTKCANLTNVRMPSSLESVGYILFNPDQKVSYNVSEGCKYLGNDENPYLLLVDVVSSKDETYRIDHNTRVIGYFALYGSENLTSLLLPEGVVSVSKYALMDSKNFKYNEYGGGIYLGTATNPYKFLMGLADEGSDSLTIHPECEVIIRQAFTLCYNLSEVTIPASVRCIQEGAFSSSGLKAISVDPSNQYYTSSNGLLLSKDGTRLIKCPDKYYGVAYLPDSVTHIENYAFAGCVNLSGVNLPSGLVSIGDYAFNSCSKMNEITLPASLAVVGKGAFQSCGVTKIIYKGDEASFEKITVYMDNYRFDDAKIKFE